MTLQASSTIVVNRKTRQMVLCIPAKIAADSHFPFKPGDRVQLRIQPGKAALIIRAPGDTHVS